MINQKALCMVSVAVLTALLSGCSGDAETIIIEREPIVSEDEHDHDHDHDQDHGATPGGDFIIESAGRLAVLSTDNMSVSIVDLDDGDILDTFNTQEGTALYASPGYRYAALSVRTMDTVGFLDGGLWREDHVDHLHDYQSEPSLTDFSISGSRPTHIDSFDSQMAVFFDGDGEANIPASIQILSDMDITTENDDIPSIQFTVNMHGVAKANGDIVLASVRRDDALTTSSNPILPDQVGVFHLHDGEYEQEQILEQACPDLHGAALNEEFYAFGCSDGVLVAHQHDDEFESVKIANIDAVGDLRVGTLYGHKEAPLFLGVASSRATGEIVLVTIDPQANTMSEFEYESEARPISYGFSFGGEGLLILTDDAHLYHYEVHEHDNELEFELAGEVHLTDADLSLLPEGTNFTMTVSQNGHYVYVADPIAEHVLKIDTESLEIDTDFHIDMAASKIVWLGIAEESDHDHDH